MSAELSIPQEVVIGSTDAEPKGSIPSVPIDRLTLRDRLIIGASILVSMAAATLGLFGSGEADARGRDSLEISAPVRTATPRTLYVHIPPTPTLVSAVR